MDYSTGYNTMPASGGTVEAEERWGGGAQVAAIDIRAVPESVFWGKNLRVRSVSVVIPDSVNVTSPTSDHLRFLCKKKGTKGTDRVVL